MGAMRLSTAPDRDDARALATVHAALDSGVTLIDTADAYCRDAGETGHNETGRLLDGRTWDEMPSAVRATG